MTLISIQSKQFPGVFLRLDGRGVTAPSDDGGGVANCQYGAGPWETFNLEVGADGTVTIGSTAFNNVFLRLDGRGVTSPQGPGGGTANAQFGAGPWETFRLVPQDDGSVAIASTAFPNVYLRMDGNGVTAPSDNGGGTVNAQYGVGPWEKFVFTVVGVKAIESQQWPGVFLRLDGTGVTAPSDNGGGVANCQYGAGPWEKFQVATNADGTVTLGSTAFNDVFLRLDGRGLTSPQDSGGGTANAQYGAGPWETFRLEPQADGSIAIASTEFPNVYLRMDGSGVTAPTGPGGGTVNGQFGVGPWEKFKFVDET